MTTTLTKSLTVTLALTTFAGIGMFTPTTTSAASWHQGTPKAMQGTWKVKGGGHLKIGKASINYGPKLGSSPAKYKYLGHHKYEVNTKLGSSFKITATKHHLKMQGTNYYK